MESMKAAEPEKSSVRGFSGQNSTGASEVSTDQGGKSELEQKLKQMSFTRSEAERLTALVHSRIMEDSPSPTVRLETSSTSGSLKRHKHGDESGNFHAAIVLEEEIFSPAELAYKGSTIGQALRQDSQLISNSATSLSKTPMASPQQPATMENLPDELLSNIFMRLLAKQLAELRLVSKSWNALLSQSSFVKSHLNRSIHNNDQILLVFYYYKESFSNFKPFAAFPRRSPHLKLTNFIKLPVNPRPRSGYRNGFKVIGAHNGLICSSYGDSVVQIWNPSLSAVLTLPPYFMPSRGDHPIKITFRFGFDPKTNDYKVVKLTGLVGDYKYVVKWWLDVEIYSMRKGTWEMITARFPPHIKHIIDGDYVCVDGHDGHLHWLGSTNDKVDSKTIVAFDASLETFREIPFPNSIPDRNRSYDLGILSRKLCLMLELGTDGVIEVWVMEEYGVAESWVKRFVFLQFYGPKCTFGFTSHNEFVIEDDGSVVFYDPIAKKQEALEGCRPEDYGVHKFVEYVDSLVWVTPGRGQN